MKCPSRAYIGPWRLTRLLGDFGIINASKRQVERRGAMRSSANVILRVPACSVMILRTPFQLGQFPQHQRCLPVSDFGLMSYSHANTFPFRIYLARFSRDSIRGQYVCTRKLRRCREWAPLSFEPMTMSTPIMATDKLPSSCLSQFASSDSTSPVLDRNCTKTTPHRLRFCGQLTFAFSVS